MTGVALATFALLVGVAGAIPAPSGGSRSLTSGSGRSTASALSTVTGPDVSSWNHPSGAPIDWGQVAASGQSFAFIKATEGPAVVGGGYYTNPYFAGDWSGAGSAGLYRGAYDFADPAMPLTTAESQAADFVKVAGRMQGNHDLPPVLDLETTGGLSIPDLITWTATWLSAVQEPDRPPADGLHEPELLEHVPRQHDRGRRLPPVDRELDDCLESGHAARRLVELDVLAVHRRRAPWAASAAPST